MIAASAGNHAQGVALSAATAGEATIVMPVTTPQDEDRRVSAWRRGWCCMANHSPTDAYARAKEEPRKLSPSSIPIDDPDVIAGQGTIGMEILRQHPIRSTPCLSPSAAVAWRRRGGVSSA